MDNEQDSAATAQPEGNIWKRAVIMVFFAIVMRVVELVLGVVMVGQFIAKLATGKTIPSLNEFGGSLSRYVAQIVQFQTFVTEKRPYPFARWPTAAANGPASGSAGKDDADAGDTPDGNTGTPNPA